MDSISVISPVTDDATFARSFSTSVTPTSLSSASKAVLAEAVSSGFGFSGGLVQAANMRMGMNRFKSILLPLDELKNDGLFKTTFINNHLINFTPVPK
jgi:hypothetical protein